MQYSRVMFKVKNRESTDVSTTRKTKKEESSEESDARILEVSR